MIFDASPLWHVSVAIHPAGRSGPLPRGLWNDHLVQAAQVACIRALHGVGDRGRAHWEDGAVSLQLRRPMTAQEARGIPRDVPIFTGRET